MADPYAICDEPAKAEQRWSLADLSGTGEGGNVRTAKIAKGDRVGRDLLDLWLDEVEERPLRLRVYEGGQEIGSKLIKSPPKDAAARGGGEHWIATIIEWIVIPEKREALGEGLMQLAAMLPDLSGLAEQWERGKWRARRRAEQAERTIQAEEAARAAASQSVSAS